MNMIERVAAAIGATFAEEQERLVDAAMAADGSLTGIADEMMAKCARAAIEAMRETPDAVVRINGSANWPQMIDAILAAALVTTPSKL